MPDQHATTWYDPGLRFTCTQCGNCCTGPPGYVFFNETEGAELAKTLGVTIETFYRDYAHYTFGMWSLNERKNDRGEYDCVFLKTDDDGKRRCSVYEARPTQCRTWPFWPENLRRPEAWERAAVRCPGMKQGLQGQGRFYPAAEIRVIRDRNEHPS